MWRGDGRQETEPLQQGPRGSVLPSPALYEAVFWTEAQDQAWGTLLRSSLSRAPTLTDITSAGGRHSRPCVRARRSVDAPFSLLLWSKTKWCAHPSSLLVLKAWGVISGGKERKRRLAMAMNVIRGMEDLVASGSQLVWSLAHQTLRRWYNRGLMPCRRLLEVWFRIGKCYQVWHLLEKSLHIAACFIWRYLCQCQVFFLWLSIEYFMAYCL